MKPFRIEDIKNILKAYNPPTYIIKRQRSEDGVDGRVVAYTDKSSYIAEQYKVLRTNLYSLSPDKPIRTLVITSSQAQEGKTITSCNLAITLSLDKEKKVILLDCDLRRPAVHSMFGISRKPGLSDILNNEIDIKNFTEKPAIGDLYLVPSGTMKSSPSEVLSSTKIKILIDKLKQKFDYIIFDTPPVLNVTDASILGSLCDAVIFIVKAGTTQKNMIEEAFHMLGEAQIKPKASILTNVHFLLDSYYYFYSYKYYKYSERKDKEG